MSVPVEPQSWGKAKGRKLGGRGCVCWGGGGGGGGGGGDNKQTSTGGSRTMCKCVLGCITIRAILVVYASVSPSRSTLPCYRYNTGGSRTMCKCVLGCITIRTILVVYASVSPSRSALPCYRYKHSVSLFIVSSSILAHETFYSIGLLKQDRAHVFAKSEK